MMNKLQNRNIFKLLVVLFVIFVLSVFFLPNLRAKYVSSNGIDDSSRTSIYYFDINSEQMKSDVEIEFTPEVKVSSENKKTVALIVTGNSETKVILNAALHLRGNLPLGIANVQYKKYGESGFTAYEAAAVTNTLESISETADGVLVVNLLPTNYIKIEENKPATGNTLEITFDIGWTDESDYDSYIYENGLEYMQLVVTVEQID